MNGRENRVRQYALDVERQQSRVREAKEAWDQGSRRMQAEHAREYSKLKGEYEREVIQLRKDEVDLEYAKSEIERGFESN